MRVFLHITLMCSNLAWGHHYNNISQRIQVLILVQIQYRLAIKCRLQVNRMSELSVMISVCFSSSNAY